MIWPNRGGGAPRVDAIAKALIRKGHQAMVHAPIGTKTEEAEKSLGYKIIPMKFIDRNDPKKIIKYGLYNPILTINLIRIINKHKIDVVFSHNLISGFPSLIASKFWKKKIVFDPTDFVVEFVGDSLEKKGIVFKIIEKIESYTIRNSTYLLTNTKTIAKIIENKYKRKPDVVYDCVDIEIFKLTKVEKPKEFIYISQGGMDPQDGLEILVEAVKRVSKQIDRFKVYMVGDGKVVPKLKKKIKEENIEKYFWFSGWVTQKEVNVLTAKSDVCLVILPNKISGRIRLTLRVLEYWACNRPIIGASLDAIKEVVKDGENGLLYEAENPKSLSEKMIMIYKDKEMYEKLKRNGYQTVQEFESKKQGDKLADIIIKTSK